MEEDHDVGCTNGGLQEEPLVAAGLGAREGIHCNVKTDNLVKKRPMVEIVMDVPLNCCKSWFELHVTGISTTKPTHINAEEGLQEV